MAKLYIIQEIDAGNILNGDQEIFGYNIIPLISAETKTKIINFLIKSYNDISKDSWKKVDLLNLIIDLEKIPPFLDFNA